jgi:hypothetical protein
VNNKRTTKGTEARRQRLFFRPAAISAKGWPIGGLLDHRLKARIAEGVLMREMPTNGLQLVRWNGGGEPLAIGAARPLYAVSLYGREREDRQGHELHDLPEDSESRQSNS